MSGRVIFLEQKRTKTNEIVVRWNSEQHFLCAIDKVRLTGMQYTQDMTKWHLKWEIFSLSSIGSRLLPSMRPSNKAHSVLRAKNKCQVIMCYIKLNYVICDVIIRERCWEAFGGSFTLRDGMQFRFYINSAVDSSFNCFSAGWTTILCQ